MDSEDAGCFHTSAVSPSPARWIEHKATIVELYGKYPLKHVQKVMEQKHGFRASKRMYDRRLKDWQCSKYMKAKDKQKLADIILTQTGTWASRTPSPKMRTVEIDDDDYRKVLRHIKSKTHRPSTTSSAVTSPRPAPSNSLMRPLQAPDTSFPQSRESWIVLPLSTTTSPEPETNVNLSSIQKGTIASSETYDIPCAYSNAETGTPDGDLTPASTAARGGVDEECMDYSHARPFSMEIDLANPTTEAFHPFQVVAPLRSLPHPQKTLNVEVVLKSVNDYIDHLAQPRQSLSARSLAEASRSSSKFWSKLKDGIYLYKVQSLDLAIPALHEVGNLAGTIVADESNLNIGFLREIFLTLSPINTKVFPIIRTLLLKVLWFLVCTNLSPKHPIAVIFHELQHDEYDREVSEKALLCMLNAFKARFGDNDPSGVAFHLRCSIIKLLRRDGDLELAATKARLLFQQSRCSLLEFDAYHSSADHSSKISGGVSHSLQTQARMAATELAHVLMDQHEPHRAEAIQMSLYVVVGESKLWSVNLRESGRAVLPAEIPESAFIQDRKTMYAMEDLAKIYQELGNLRVALQWLEKARAFAERVLGYDDEGTAKAHIIEKIDDLNMRLHCI